MRTWVLLVVGACGLSMAALAQGCAVHDPLYCDAEHPCADPARPVCDLLGQFDESDHIKNTCIPTPANCPVDVCGCTPGELLACDATAAVRCGTDGMSSATETCSLGCDASLGGCKCTLGDSKCEGGAVEVCEANGAFSTPSPCVLGCAADGKRCIDISASNGLNAALDAGGDRSDFTLAIGAVFDTSTGTVVDGGGSAVLIPSVLIAQTGGAPPIRAFLTKSITIHGASVVGANAFAIAADDTITVDGTLDLRPAGVAAGPGASTATACRGADAVATSTAQTSNAPGAGGGGHAVAGAAGGNYGGTGSGAGGSLYGSAQVVPLEGGCAGGRVAVTGGAVWATGGRGGGAAQLVARRAIRVVSGGASRGLINAGGSGGFDTGGGGGAGGSVLLEAPVVVVEGIGTGVFVNGGAAGCSGQAGASGLSSSEPAQAPCPTEAAGGGAGGTGLLAPTRGPDLCAMPADCFFRGSAIGGGGAAGLLRVNTASGSFAPSGGAMTSAKSSVGTLQTR